LCPLCCGQLRGKEIRCPPACPHLSRHRPYQERKIIEKRPQHGVDLPRDERLKWLILNIEALLERIAVVRPEFADRDAVLALEAAREKIERARPALLVTESSGRVDSEPGEILFQGIERCRFEGQIVLPQPLQIYTKEEKLAALDDLIMAVKRLAGDGLEARNFLSHLIQRFAKGRGAPPQGQRIISVR